MFITADTIHLHRRVRSVSEDGYSRADAISPGNT